MYRADKNSHGYVKGETDFVVYQTLEILNELRRKQYIFRPKKRYQPCYSIESIQANNNMHDSDQKRGINPADRSVNSQVWDVFEFCSKHSKKEFDLS